MPFWLLWGIAGAESTWGKGGTNLFGLLDAAEGANISDWGSAADQAAKTLAGLRRTYGSWSAAVDHYSGYSYTINRPRELAEGQGVRANNAPPGTYTPAGSSQFVDLKTPLGNIPLPGPTLDFTNPFGPLSPLDPRDFGAPGEIGKGLGGGGVGELLSFPGEFIGAANAATALFTALTDVKFWIRVAEAIGGLILVYMALKNLTGVRPPGEAAIKSAAKAAAYKRLPPKQRVK